MNESRSRFGKKINGRAQGTGMFKWFMLLIYILYCVPMSSQDGFAGESGWRFRIGK